MEILSLLGEDDREFGLLLLFCLSILRSNQWRFISTGKGTGFGIERKHWVWEAFLRRAKRIWWLTRCVWTGERRENCGGLRGRMAPKFLIWETEWLILFTQTQKCGSWNWVSGWEWVSHSILDKWFWDTCRTSIRKCPENSWKWRSETKKRDSS